MASKPAYRVYTVVKRENADDFWLNIGVAFKHEDNLGLNILLQALPVDGKLVLREYRDDADEKEKDKPRDRDRRR